jgi:hypothetical protein
MFGERLLRILHHALVLLVVVGTTIVLTAQTVVDPRYVEFNPSVDHNATHTDGTPLVQRYSLSIYQTGSSTAVDTMDLGKPAPDGSNIIRVDFRPLLHVQLTPGQMYEARVMSVGPGGTTPSGLTNDFYFQPTCTPGISPTSISPSGSGATGSVAVTVASGCTWSAVTNAGWITLTGAASGNGNGSVPYSVAANPTTTPRSGTLTIAGQTFTVNQAGATCSYSLLPTSQSVAASASTGSTNVTAPSGCTWNATSNASSWLTVTGGSSGNGNGTVSFSATANPDASQRSGTLTIGGQTFTVTQAPASCSYSLTPTSQSVAASASTGSTNVTAPSGCTWSATSNASSWLTVTGGSSGNGNGTVSFGATANPNASQRSGTLTIGGQTFTVTQAAATCSYSLSPTSQNVASTGGTGSTSLTAPGGCNWTATSNASTWLTITSAASGTGGGTVSFSATANPNASQRQGTLTIGGQTFTVTQAAATCSYALSPTSQNVAATGGTGSTGVTAPGGCNWTATSNASSWLTITNGSSGSGDGTVSFSATANPNASQRQGTLTIGGQTFTVTQAAATCSYTLSPTSQTVPSTGGTGSTGVTAPGGCNWTATSNASTWLTITGASSGTGNGTVSFSATANPNATQRQGTLTIGGQTFTATQSAAPCTFSISPTSQSFGASGGTGSTTVTAPGGCNWTAITNASSWLTITSGSSGSGTGTVNFSASTNPNTTPRNGTLTIAGQTFDVAQAAASCTFSLNPTSQSVAATGGTGSTAVTTSSNCSWSGSSNASWLTITSAASGTGNGTVSFSAAANPAITSRTGTLTISGQTFTVTQAAGTCAYSLNPTSQSMAVGGGTGSTAVTAQSGCTWTATSNASWLTITSGGSGSGNGTVNYSGTANPNVTSRTGTLTVGGQTFTVTQAPATCAYSINPTSQSMAASGGTGSTAVTAQTGCAWTATSNASWLTITSGGSGNGNGTVSFSGTSNPTTQARSGTLTVAGRTFTVNQSAGSCSYTISPTSQSVAVGGGTGSTTVTTTSACTWTAVSNASFITVTSGASGTGNGATGFSIQANPTTSSRTGTLTIAGRTFTVTQAAGTCSYNLSPSSRNVSGSAETGTFNVNTSTGCAWTAQSNVSWITTVSSGTGSGSVTFAVLVNLGVPRSGTITVGGQTFTVSQNSLTLPGPPGRLRVITP